jgi:hypothetical protein
VGIAAKPGEVSFEARLDGQRLIGRGLCENPDSVDSEIEKLLRDGTLRRGVPTPEVRAQARQVVCAGSGQGDDQDREKDSVRPSNGPPHGSLVVARLSPRRHPGSTATVATSRPCASSGDR